MKSLLNATLLSILAFAQQAQASNAAPDCSYDRKAMLALDENAFDQDLSNGGGGWRGVAGKHGCIAAAADLIDAYRKAHPDASTTLAWHEGQMRASLGQDAKAIALFDAARHPPERDKAGWNHYVDATIAFLRHDRPALQAARDALAKVPYAAAEGMPPALDKDGYIEFPAEDGQPTFKMRWPPNIEIVEAFLNCFDKSYDEAYGNKECRTKKG